MSWAGLFFDITSPFILSAIAYFLIDRRKVAADSLRSECDRQLDLLEHECSQYWLSNLSESDRIRSAAKIRASVQNLENTIIDLESHTFFGVDLYETRWLGFKKILTSVPFDTNQANVDADRFSEILSELGNMRRMIIRRRIQ
ncbi:MAG: hypothetical protein U9P68_08095 [Pseudomonadota bacterium]|nr:hypothetical protein [Pseudomonadota bacterium]